MVIEKKDLVLSAGILLGKINILSVDKHKNDRFFRRSGTGKYVFANLAMTPAGHMLIYTEWIISRVN